MTNFKTTATLHHIKNMYVNFGVHPKHRYMWGVKDDEPIYEVEFEVVEENPTYPDDTQTIEYYGFRPSYKDECSLIQPNCILFSVQFPYAVFEYTDKHKSLGTVLRLKMLSAIKID